MKTILAVSAALLLVTLPAVADHDVDSADRDWPHWRGPHKNGVAPHANPPVEWSETKNVRFKVELPGLGLATPIIWKDRIYVMSTAALDQAAYEASQKAAAEVLERKEWPPKVDPVAQRFLVTAYSRTDGSVVWEKAAIEKVPHESHYIESSWAAASPLTDGERLYVNFGSNGLYTYDLDGNLLWQVDLGDQITRNGFGEGSSPAVHGDTLVVNWDHEGESFVVALDKKTGKERWRTPRPDEVTSWATPLIVEHGGRNQVVIPATGKSRGYDLATGEEIWSATGMTVNTIPSPVYRDGIVYLMSGYRGTMLQAISLAKARGELNGTDAIVWTHERHTPYVPSPLLYDDKLYFVKHLKNIFSCLDAETGEVHYTEVRLDSIKNVWSSPVGAAGRIYVLGRTGTTAVLEHGAEYKVIATNSLDDEFDASPAIAGNEIYLRGKKYLYVIAKTPSAKGP